ncbi:hypothetical protein PR003_g31221, partial [Phytophthora rubi]
MALAAVTVNVWAIEANTGAKIVGDVVGNPVVKPVADSIYITPRHTAAQNQGKLMHDTLWATEMKICAIHSGAGRLPGKRDMVQALGRMEYFKGKVELQWRGRRLLVNMRPMMGSLCDQYISTEITAHGTFITEWLPYVDLATARLYTATGRVVTPTSQFKLICTPGQQLRDVIHWKWMDNGGLVVTALARKVSKPVQRQIGGLIRLLLLNYPQLTRRGEHTGAVTYFTADDTHVPVTCQVTADRHFLSNVQGSAATEPVTLESHRDLVAAMQTEVGPTTTITEVLPHPRLARLVCLWAGKRRWKTPRRIFKAKLRIRAEAKGTAIAATRQGRWAEMSKDAAAGITVLAWKRIRRVVGLNPWGEQILLRIKHQAVSLFNPVTAGIGCPHADCVRLDRIDLHHVFWGCPAATELRASLINRWKSAGVKRTDFEEAIFSLTLQGTPTGIARATGRIVAELPADQIEELGDAIEKATASCWSIGAAQYLLAVWRWRVAFFDNHNDVSPACHVAGLANRLRSGHRDVTQDCLAHLPPQLCDRISSVICTVLGAEWAGHDHAVPRGGYCYLVAFAGRSATTGMRGSS